MIVLFFADTGKRLSVRLFEDGEDLEKGRLSMRSVLGKIVCGAEEGDEVEFADERINRKVLIESVEKSLMLEVSGESIVELAAEPRPAAAVG